MRSASKIVALSGAVFMLAGCAGIPTAVSVAGMYVNSLLMLRTSKGVADHAVSAAMAQDCGFVNIMEHGAYCIDAPAPQLLAAMTADADMLAPATPSAPIKSVVTAVAPAETSSAALAAAAPLAAEAPNSNLSPPATTATAVLPVATQTPATTTEERFLVVLASYRNPATAAAHAARLKRKEAVVTLVEVRGEAFHRVALRAASQPAALRMLSQAKASGASGAWVVAGAASGGKHPVGPADAPKPARPTPNPPAYAAAPMKPLL